MSTDLSGGSTGGGGEFMLFGVRVVVDSMRKSVSLNNLSQYDHRLDYSPPPPPPLFNDNNKEAAEKIAAGYASSDDVIHNYSAPTAACGGNRDRKRGVPWTEDEHKLFLQGLQRVGKGDWRGISRNFVKTRTPTQVASHAQKYFLRRSNINRRRRRSSLFDITTDSVAADNVTEDQMIQDNKAVTGQPQSPPQQAATSSEISNQLRFSLSPPTPMYQFSAGQQVVSPTPLSATTSSSKVDFDLNNFNSSSNIVTDHPSPALSLNLSLSMSSRETSSRNNGMIRVI